MMKAKDVIWGCSGIGCLASIVIVVLVGSYVWSVAKAFEDLGNPDVRRTWFDNSAKIGDAIGIRLPDFTVKEYIPQKALHFTGDFTDSLIVEFNERLPEGVFKRFEEEAAKIGKSNEEDFCRVDIRVDSIGLRYSNPRIFGYDQFLCITLWRDSINGVIVYGKW